MQMGLLRSEPSFGSLDRWNYLVHIAMYSWLYDFVFILLKNLSSGTGNNVWVAYWIVPLQFDFFHKVLDYLHWKLKSSLLIIKYIISSINGGFPTLHSTD